MKQLWHDYMQYTDKELSKLLSSGGSVEGKYARKEIHRRNMIGYCDGTTFQKVKEQPSE